MPAALDIGDKHAFAHYMKVCSQVMSDEAVPTDNDMFHVIAPLFFLLSGWFCLPQLRAMRTVPKQMRAMPPNRTMFTSSLNTKYA